MSDLHATDVHATDVHATDVHATGGALPPAAPDPTPGAAAAGCPYPGPVETDAATCPFPEGAAADRTSVCGYAGKGKRGYFIPGLIALAVLLAGGALATAGGLSHAAPTQLDGIHVGTLIAENYQQNHQLASPPPVQCPGSEPVVAGHHFVCQLLRSKGGPLPVDVTETGGGRITYQVPGGP